MDLFVIDQEKCTKCGNCAAACPRTLIELKEQNLNGFPAAIPGADEACIGCGHCVVVCLHDALSHQTMVPDQCPPIQEERLPGPHQVEHLLRSRRSVRSYQDKPVERELLEKLIDIARHAPSGDNSQPVHWLIIYDKDEVIRILEKMIAWARYTEKKHPEVAKATFAKRFLEVYDSSGKDCFLREAPHIIITHSRQGELTAKISCSVAMTYLELAAFSYGLATCWDEYIISVFNYWAPLRNALNLPQGHVIYGAMLIGYPNNKFLRIPLRNQPKITWR